MRDMTASPFHYGEREDEDGGSEGGICCGGFAVGGGDT